MFKDEENTFTISCQYQKYHSLDGIDWWAIVITWRRLQLFDTVCFLQNAAPGQGSDDVRLRCVAALNVARRELLEVKRTGGLLHLLLLLGDAGDVRVLCRDSQPLHHAEHIFPAPQAAQREMAVIQRAELWISKKNKSLPKN